MAFSRYARTPTALVKEKLTRFSSSAAAVINNQVQSGRLQVSTFTLSEGQRLDVVSANYYGVAEYWWIIAAASGIGWQCQVPAGTVLKIPVSLERVVQLVG